MKPDNWLNYTSTEIKFKDKTYMHLSYLKSLNFWTLKVLHACKTSIKQKLYNEILKACLIYKMTRAILT